MAKRLGIIPTLFAKPLFEGLQSRGHPNREFQLIEDVPAQLSIKLREKSLDAAFLSPVDYARDYAMYSILPKICVAADSQAMSALILFKQGLRKISTLAVSPASSSEIVLANIVLAELFDGMPTVIPFPGKFIDGLAKADAVLCTGDDAIAAAEYPSRLNLIEEWSEITDLPFVHGFWVTRPEVLTPEEITDIISVGEEAVKALPGESQDQEYFRQFHYLLDEKARSGLSEFFRMAYYHGILMDIPDLRFIDEEGSVPPSPN